MCSSTKSIPIFQTLRRLIDREKSWSWPVRLVIYRLCLGRSALTASPCAAGLGGPELLLVRRSRRIRWKDGTYLEVFLYRFSPDLDPMKTMHALGRVLHRFS